MVAPNCFPQQGERPTVDPDAQICERARTHGIDLKPKRQSIYRSVRDEIAFSRQPAHINPAVAMSRIILPARSQSVRGPVDQDPDDAEALTRFIDDNLAAASVAMDRDLLACSNGLLCEGDDPISQCWANEKSKEKWISRRGRLKYSASKWLGRRQTLNRPSLWITDNWSRGYFHWICEALCRLELTAMSCDLSEYTLVLPTKYRRSAFVAKTLAMYDLGDVRYLDQFERLKCTRMTLPTLGIQSGNFREEILHRLRDRVLKYAGDRREGKQRIYFSRAKAGRRCIVNESDLIPILKRFGFQIRIPEEIEWSAQIRILSDASHFVSNHGAALTNMIAMPSGGEVFEMRHRIGATPNCFLTMASALELKFHYQMVDAVDSTKSVYRGDMKVDPIAFQQKIERMLTRGQ